MISKIKTMVAGIVFILCFGFLTGCNLPTNPLEYIFIKTFMYDTGQEEYCKDDGGTWYFDENLDHWTCQKKYSKPLEVSEDDVLVPLSEGEEFPGEGEVEVPSQIEPLPEGEGISFLAGTYEGSTTIGEAWIGYWGGAVVSDEITIVIANDGTVTGSLTSVWSETTEPIEWGDSQQTCVTQTIITENGTLSGILVDTTGKIEIFMDRTKEFNRSGCPSGYEVQPSTGNVYADVYISGNIISGSSPDYFSFEATKR